MANGAKEGEGKKLLNSKKSKKSKKNPANKKQLRPTKFQDFTAKNIIDTQATLNFRPFLVPHSNTEKHKNSFFLFFFFLFFFFFRATTDWNHLSDDQVKAPHT